MIATEKVGSRVYVTGDTYAIRDRLKSLGCHWDGDRRQWWVGIAKAAQLETLIAGLDDHPAKANLDDSRVKAKVRYKGHVYYVIAETDQDRCRLVTLDGQVDFWTDMAECDLLKTYPPREVRVGFGRYTQTVFTTIGSIRRFIAEQRAAEAQGLPACAACGRRSADLVEDLEDGLLKHRACCDMPPF